MSKTYSCNQRHCDWVGPIKDLLMGKSPFDGDTIVGCPKCKSIDSVVRTCDYPGCHETTSAGTPTKDGYVWTCHEHVPKGDPDEV